ncbi:hypothetical protein CHU98_g12196 [Xylaria longipes]|nr:hypothetical protein CHU98_g12196 [Xylaria longipes]
MDKPTRKRKQADERESSRKHSHRDLSTLADECDECRDIHEILCIASELSDDPGYFELTFPKSKNAWGFRLANVGQRFLEPRDTRCQLCLMLWKARIDLELAMVGLKKDHIKEHSDELRALPFTLGSGLIIGKEVNQGDSLALLIGPREGFKGRGSEVIRKLILAARNGVAVLSRPQGVSNSAIPQPIPEYYEPSMIRDWIQYCQKYHKLCLPNPSVVKDLQLIDCDTRTIRPAAEGDQYVALSYLWGKSDTHSDHGMQHASGFRELPVTLPQVIDDAISVTMALGYHYLWVDKFCIDQDDWNIKHDQIRQMHIIYEKAELTIVSACGIDQNDGLAGTSTPRLGAQITTKLGEANLSWVIDPHRSIRSSRWSTRGWTFQEAVLARRRLVFTKEQIYFECNAMSCCENLHAPLDSLHIKTRTKIKDIFRAGMFGRGQQFGRMNPKTLSIYDMHLQYCACVEDYSTRELTYDSDALNAFFGIIKRFELNEGKALETVQGLSYPTSERFSVRWDYLCHSLCWRHHGSINVKRRPQFPSWTWAGWSGGVHFANTGGGHTYDRYCFAYRFRELAFEDQSGTRRELPQNEHQSQSSNSAYMYLCLKAHTVPASAFTYSRHPKAKSKSGGLQRHAETGASWRLFEYDANLYLSEKGLSDLQLSEELKNEHIWRCIFVADMPGMHQCWFMLLKKMSSEIWSRAGLFRVYCHGLTFYGNAGFYPLLDFTKYKIG